MFKDYLSKWCDSVKYEHGIGSSYPDFSIWSQDDEPIAFWEIAEKEFTAQNANEIQQELDDIQQSGISVKSGYSEGYSVLQYKIKKKSAQFRGCGSIPGMLVYADWTNYYMPTKSEVAAAILGDPTLVISQEGDYLGNSRRPNGKMVDSKYSHINNHISAVALFREEAIQTRIQGLDELTNEAIKKFRYGHPVFKFVENVKKEISSKVDLARKYLFLDIFLNPHAHVAWPLELHGPYDRIFDVSESELHPTIVFDGQKPIQRIRLPESDVQRDIQDLMNDPNLRNE